MTTGPTRPGIEVAHVQLRAVAAAPPARRRPDVPDDAGASDARHAAVLLLFGVLDAVPAHARHGAVARDLDVLLLRRADSLTHHPGQVSFPGGRLDPADADAPAAALREAQEETGLDPAGVEVLGTLPDVPLPVSDHRVTPVLGWWSRPSPIRVVDRRESAAVFRAPVADLLDAANRRSVRLDGPVGAELLSPAFLVSGHVVWGFTAHVLDELFDVLGWTEPWDPERTVPIDRLTRIPGRPAPT